MSLRSKKCNAVCFIMFIGVTLNRDCITVEFGGTRRCGNAVVGKNVQASGNNDRGAAIVVDQMNNVCSTQFFGESVEE